MNEPKAVTHGAYVDETIYEIIQHKYVAGGHPGCGGYMELLEIKNAPHGKCGIVIHEHSSGMDSEESRFAEWQSLPEALEAFEKWWGADSPFIRFARMPGFLRRVNCEQQTPWFYAKVEVPGDCVPLKGRLF